MALGSTLPSGPASTAVTVTEARLGTIVSPTSSAGGTRTARSVRNRIPEPVLTTLPLGTLFELVGSRLSKRTLPVALASSIRLPVAGNVSPASTSIVSSCAGTTGGEASASGAVASVLATIRSDSGPMVPSRGAITAVAVGRYRNAAAPPTTRASATTASPTTSGVRPMDGRNDRPTGSGRNAPGRSCSMAGVSATTRAAGIAAGARPARFGPPLGGADDRGPRSVAGVVAGPMAEVAIPASVAATPAVAAPAEAVDAGASAPAAAVAPAVERSLSGERPFVLGVATVSLTRVPSASPSSLTAAASGPSPSGLTASGPSASDRSATGSASPDATPDAAAAATAPASASVPDRSSANEDSYSPTVAKIGRPADAASARVAPSPATMESRLPLVSASRARRRKLIRDVATREPYGSTTATRLPSVDRMRAAAEVISSSMSR